MVVSVIVPVYNTELYLEECIQSIVNQTYRALEIIIINDGSTDNSGAICRKWEKLDNRIRYIEKENEGQGIARNIGIRLSAGDYIIFADSDDYMDEHLIADTLEVITKEDADICVFGHYGLGDELYLTPLNFKIAEGNSVKENKELLGNMMPILWDKMFSSALIKNAHLVMSNHICEDLVFNAQLYVRAKKICTLDKPLYYYRYKREGNLSTNYERYTEVEASINELNRDFFARGYFEEYWMQLYEIAFYMLKDILFRMKKREDLKVPAAVKDKYGEFFNAYIHFLDKWFSPYLNIQLQKKNYLLIGSYNLRVIIHTFLLDEEHLKKDYGYSNIVSLMSEPEDLPGLSTSIEACAFKNAYRKRCVKQDMEKHFYQKTDFRGIDYIVIDLLDEIFDLIEVNKHTYLTESEFLKEICLQELKDCRRISLLSPERRSLFAAYAEKFAEKVNALHIPVILIKNILCEKHNEYYDVSTVYNNLDHIREINKELEWCYALLCSFLSNRVVIDISATKELLFTKEDFPFGCKPVYYNKSYYDRMAIEIASCVRDGEG